MTIQHAEPTTDELAAWAEYISQTTMPREIFDAQQKQLSQQFEQAKVTISQISRALLHESWEHVWNSYSQAWRTYIDATEPARLEREAKLAQLSGRHEAP